MDTEMKAAVARANSACGYDRYALQMDGSEATLETFSSLSGKRTTRERYQMPHQFARFEQALARGVQNYLDRRHAVAARAGRPAPEPDPEPDGRLGLLRLSAGELAALERSLRAALDAGVVQAGDQGAVQALLARVEDEARLLR